jgi:protein-disulfide isomerase
MMSTAKPSQRPMVFGLVIIAVLAAAAVILMANNTGVSSSRDYSSIPQSRTEDGAFVLGNPDAPITIVEFADFTCPHCQEYVETTHRFINDYVVTGKAKFEYRMYPIVHPQYAPYSAAIAECADDLQPGAFWKAHDMLFQLASQGRYDDMGRIIAEELDISYSDLLECLPNAQQYTVDYRLGQSLGVQGTPAIMMRIGDGPMEWLSLNGRSYERGGAPFSILAQIVDSVQ